MDTWRIGDHLATVILMRYVGQLIAKQINATTDNIFWDLRLTEKYLLINVCIIPSPVRVGKLLFRGSWDPYGLRFFN